MTSWRDQKTAMKAAVHANFLVPAVYLPYTAGTPITVNVRHHDAAANVGIPIMQLREHPPTFEDSAPKIIFDAAELPMASPKAYVILSATEIYRVGSAGPVLYGYFTADVAALSAEDCAELVARISALGPLNAAYTGILP